MKTTIALFAGLIGLAIAGASEAATLDCLMQEGIKVNKQTGYLEEAVDEETIFNLFSDPDTFASTVQMEMTPELSILLDTGKPFQTKTNEGEMVSLRSDIYAGVTVVHTKVSEDHLTIFKGFCTTIYQ